MDIRNRSDYKRGYSWLRMLTESLDKGEFHNPKLAKTMVIDLKRQLRAYANKPANFDPEYGIERRIVDNDDADGYVEVLSIPEACVTKAEAEEFFENCIYIESPNSPYDCTGFAFTSWYHIFKRRGQFWAYHRVAFDV